MRPDGSSKKLKRFCHHPSRRADVGGSNPWGILWKRRWMRAFTAWEASGGSGAVETMSAEGRPAVTPIGALGPIFAREPRTSSSSDSRVLRHGRQ